LTTPKEQRREGRMPKFPPGTLVRMLQSTNPDVAHGAAHDLIAAGQAAVPALVKALEEGSPTLRLHAAQILGEIGPPAQEAVAALEAARPDPVLRAAVENALGKIRRQASAIGGT
jgi:HEAT repeat protein